MATKRVDVRLETDLWERLERFRILNSIETPSAAIRAAVEVALRDTEAIESTWRKAAWSEGHKAGAKAFREKLDKALERDE